MVNFGFLETANVPVYIRSNGVVYTGPDVDIVLAEGSALPGELSNDALPYQITGIVKGSTETGDDYNLVFYSEDEGIIGDMDGDHLFISNTDESDHTVLRKLLDVRKESSGKYPTFRCEWKSLLKKEEGEYYLHIQSHGSPNNPMRGLTNTTRMSEDLFNFVKDQVAMEEASEKGQDNTVYEPINGKIKWIAKVISAPSREQPLGLRLKVGEQSDYYDVGVETDATSFMNLFKNVLHTTQTNETDKKPIPR